MYYPNPKEAFELSSLQVMSSSFNVASRQARRDIARAFMMPFDQAEENSGGKSNCGRGIRYIASSAQTSCLYAYVPNKSSERPGPCIFNGTILYLLWASLGDARCT